jgi:hypothetical protein
VLERIEGECPAFFVLRGVRVQADHAGLEVDMAPLQRKHFLGIRLPVM